MPQEHLTNVKVPISLLESLYAMQKEPSGFEWGGGIDFEIIMGKPQVERVLAYFGEEARVPGRILEKYKDDVEVAFHTHPGQVRAQPSPEDIHSFLTFPQQVEFIVAGNEILVLEKTPETKQISYDEVKDKLPSKYSPEDLPVIRKTLEKLGVKTTLFRYTTLLEFDLNVVRDLTSEQFKEEDNLVNNTSPIAYILHLLRIHKVPQHLRFDFKDIVYWSLDLFDRLKSYCERLRSQESFRGEGEKITQQDAEEEISVAIRVLYRSLKMWFDHLKRFATSDWLRREEMPKETTYDWGPMVSAGRLPGLYAQQKTVRILKELIRDAPLMHAFPGATNSFFLTIIEHCIYIYRLQAERQVLLGRKASEERLDTSAESILNQAHTVSRYMSVFIAELKTQFSWPKFYVGKPEEHVR